MNLRPRLLRAIEKVIGALVVATLLGSVLAFGGGAWWSPPALAIACGSLAVAGLVRMLIEGRFSVLKSPLGLLGWFALAFGVAQLAPLPAAISGSVSPNSRAAYAVGFLPDRARQLEPSVELPEPPAIRSPVSVDRSATLRWVAGAAACLAVFWTASHFADRLGHLYLIWGCVVAGFFLNTAFAVVQVSSGNGGLYGFIQPGRGPIWAPDLNDLGASPNTAWLRASGDEREGGPSWALLVPDRPFLIGTQLGGPGAYLALGALGLPLGFGLLLQIMAPRGSREPLALRLAQEGRGGLVTLMVSMLMASAFMVGLLAGPWFALPYAIGIVVVGLPSARPTGLRWTAVALTTLALLSLGGGAAAGRFWEASRTTPPPVAPLKVETSVAVWKDALPLIDEFPLLGTGLGTFASVYPYYKSTDGSPTTAMSSLLQWAVETGLVGIGLLGLAGLWCLTRTPRAVRSVGPADRALVFGLIGAGLAFTLFSAVHWTVELTSVALAASAVGGTLNRWLAGGTDLFAQRA